MSRATVVIELDCNAQALRDLAAGGVYVPGCGLRLAQDCDLVVCNAHRRLVLPARVVYIDDRRGAGLELVGFTLETRAQLAELVAPERDSPPVGAPQVEEFEPDRSTLDDPALEHHGPPADDHGYGPLQTSAPMIDLQALDDELSIPFAHGSQDDIHTRIASTAESASADEASLFDTFPDDDAESEAARAEHLSVNSDAFDTLEPDAIEGRGDAPGDAGAGGCAKGSRPIARNLHERMRGLTLAAQIKMATSGELHERIVLERLYGKNVWETLLRNPRLSPPEVSKIARYGTLPRVLLEIIVGNNAWLQVPEVRRAVLSNPRLAADQIMKVLRLMPKHELKLAAIQTVYPHAVRNVAKMLLRSE